MSSENLDNATLMRAARRAEASHADLIAGLIPQWRRAFPGDDPGAAIGANAATLAQIALCRRPREQSWLDDAIAVARATGADPDRVIRFLRTAEALEKLAKDDVAAVPGVSLMAARDREEDPN